MSPVSGLPGVPGAPGGPQGWTGGTVADGLSCVLAPNHSAMTLDGTNTWLLHRPGAAEAVVLDPGPLHEEHLQAVAREASHRGVRITMVLISHGHHDHTEGMERFAQLVDAPIVFPGRDRVQRAGSQGQAGADAGGDDLTPRVLEVDGLRIEALPTPGHTFDSYCFHLPQHRVLLTGDTILGRGTTVVTWPDGALAPYLESLTRLRELAAGQHVRVVLPGHGAPVTDVLGLIDYYVAHRHERLEQVREALAGAAIPDGSDAPMPADGKGSGELARLVEHVVRTVYVDAPEQVWPAARQSVRAQLEYLRVKG